MSQTIDNIAVIIRCRYNIAILYQLYSSIKTTDLIEMCLAPRLLDSLSERRYVMLSDEKNDK